VPIKPLSRSELDSKINGDEKADSEKTATGSPKIIFRTTHQPIVTGPLNVLGGGSWRWPNSPSIDAKTRVKITWSEVGGTCVDWPACDDDGGDR
jgi:hypothetical protein